MRDLHICRRTAAGMPLLILCVGLACSVWAQGDFDARYGAALGLYDDGRYGSARTEFEAAFELEPGHLATSFYLGRCALETGDYEAAVLAFERVLMIDPDMPRVKAELARSYFHMRLYDVAERYFQDALAAGPPPEAERNITAFLEQIRTLRKRHFFSGYLQLSAMRDTNARVSPLADTVDTVVGVVRLDDVAQDQRDFVGSAALGLAHRYNFENRPWSWSTNGLVYSAFYEDADDLDLSHYSVLSGPGFHRGRLSLSLRGAFSFLERDSDRYLRTYGAVAGAGYAVHRSVMAVAEARVEDRSYYAADNAGRDGVDVRVSAGSVGVWAGNRCSVKTGYERLNAAAATEAYEAVFVEFDVTRPLGHGFSVFAGYDFEKRLYDGREVLFGDRRDEDEHAFSVGVQKLFGRHVATSLSHAYTVTDSSIELYDYDRNVTALTLSVIF